MLRVCVCARAFHCVLVCMYERLSRPCQISHDCLLRVCQPGVTFFSVCALGNVCVYACRAAGRESPCLHCAGELEGTPRSSVLGWVCVIVGVSHQIERGWCSTSVWSHFSNVWLHAFSIRLLHFVHTLQTVCELSSGNNSKAQKGAVTPAFACFPCIFSLLAWHTCVTTCWSLLMNWIICQMEI